MKTTSTYSTSKIFKDFAKNEYFHIFFFSLLSEINYAFKPDAIVVQVGADSLANDPLGGFNLTPLGIGQCISKVINLLRPTLILGGGGYNLANASRLWTYITGLVLGQELPVDIPDADPYFDQYGPSFELSLTPGCRSNANSNEEICDNLEEAFRNLEEL